jgi:hypothetical protein
MNVKLKKLNSLANAANKAHNADMKKIWTKQWNKLVNEYALDIKVRDIFKPDPYNEHLNKTRGDKT